MRTLVLLLVLANLTMFGYTRLDSVGSGEGARLAQQVQPDKIAVLTPQQVAALGPAKAAALADVCIEWGPLSDTDRARALADLESLALGKLLTQKRVDVATKVGARTQTVAQTAFVIRDPPQPVIVRLRELAPGYPGADVRIGTCDKSG